MNQKSNLYDLIPLVTKELEKSHYSKHSINIFTTVWNHLKDYMKQRNEQNFSTKIGLNFLEYEYGITAFKKLSSENRRRCRAINLLFDYILHGMIFPKAKRTQYNFAPQFHDIIQNYIDNKKSEGLSIDTIRSCQIYLSRFSEYLNLQKISKIENMNENHVLGFTNTFIQYSPSVIHNTLSSLRTFFHYLYENGYTLKNYAYIVPKDSYRQRTKIPSSYTEEEIQKILKSIDRGNPKGKRDYAMILLAARLGLRAQDICDLTFSNLIWEKSIIEIYQHKTNKKNILPLLEDVGIAIIDYLKYARPEHESNIVFLRLVAPIGKLEASTLHSIVTQHMQRARIKIDNGKKHGPHALRHSLASMLLEKNVSLPVISEVLGHTNSKSTSIYLNIDVNQLRKCSLNPRPFIWNKGEEEF
jgi:integrase/recombinase XerD